MEIIEQLHQIPFEHGDRNISDHGHVCDVRYFEQCLLIDIFEGGYVYDCRFWLDPFGGDFSNHDQELWDRCRGCRELFGNNVDLWVWCLINNTKTH